MARLRKTKVIEDHPTWLFKVRIDLAEGVNPHEIVTWIQKYVESREFNVLQAVAGTHKECDRKVPHIHYHAVIDVKPTIKMFKAGERYKMKQELNQDKPSWYVPSSNALSCVVEKPKVDANSLMSVEECINKFLRYPLKENLCLENGVVGYTPDEIVTMAKFAYDEFQETLRQRREAQLKVEEDRLKWKVVCRELDNSGIHSYRQACLCLMRFGDKWEDYQKINQDRIHNLARNYCRYAKIVTDEILLQNPTHLMLYNVDEVKLKKGRWVDKYGCPENIILH